MTRTETRRRQANGLDTRITFCCTFDQVERWKAEATQDGITLPRWIADRLDNRPRAMIQRAVIAEVTGIRYEVRGAMANLNQLALRAHTERVDLPGWAASVAAIAAQGDALDQLVERLSS